MTRDFIRAPEDKVRLWNFFLRFMGVSLAGIMLFLLALALVIF